MVTILSAGTKALTLQVHLMASLILQDQDSALPPVEYTYHCRSCGLWGLHA